MQVLVTGGSGWIGQATQAALKRARHSPVCFDRSDGDDVRNATSVFDAVRRVDHVVHLAGLLGTHELFARPATAVEVNVLGSLHVTQACADLNVGLTEITMPRVNPSLYAATKACAMDIAEAYRIAGRLRVSYVRAYNAFGPGQCYGGDHPQKIIPTFASRGWIGEPLPVWGNGTLLTDLVHVDDVARMLVEAMAFGDGQVFDAGTGYAQPVLAVAERVIELTGGQSKVEFLAPRPGERAESTQLDWAAGDGWELLNGWHPIFEPERLAQTVDTYRP